MGGGGGPIHRHWWILGWCKQSLWCGTISVEVETHNKNYGKFWCQNKRGTTITILKVEDMQYNVDGGGDVGLWVCKISMVVVQVWDDCDIRRGVDMGMGVVEWKHSY